MKIGFVAGSIGGLMLDRAQKKMQARLMLKQKQQLQSGLDQQAIADQNHESEYVREQAEFYLMRRIQSRARSRQLWFLTAISTVALITYPFVWQPKPTLAGAR